jgi:uncharacterized membrane protein
MEFTAKRILFIMLLLVILADIAIFLDVPLARPVLGGFLLLVLPGWLILYALHPDDLRPLDLLTVAVGISVGFMLLFGVILNNMALFAGFYAPLSLLPLMAFFNAFVIASALLGYRLNRGLRWTLEIPRLSATEKLFLVVPVIFPAMSVAGVQLMNTGGNNALLIALLLLIALYICAIFAFRDRFPERLYPAVIFLISLSALLILALRSNHIIGTDTHYEYYTFMLTLEHGYWALFEGSLLDSCICISVLPAIVQKITGLAPELLFKLIYPAIFSIAPLVVFGIVRKYLDDAYSFLAAVFFIAQPIFIWTTANARTSVALLFFALFVLVLFKGGMHTEKKRLLLVFFMASAIVSHYSTTFIFFYIVLGTWIGTTLLSTRFRVKKVITVDLVIIFGSLMFIWYSLSTVVPWELFVEFSSNALQDMGNLFNTGSMGADMQTLLGTNLEQRSVASVLQFLLTWMTFGCIGIGILGFLKRYREMTFPRDYREKAEFLREKFEVTYAVMAILSAALLVLVVALPYLSDHYDANRVYPLVITVLAVFFVIGGIFAANLIERAAALLRRRSGEAWSPGRTKAVAVLILLAVLIPYFLSGAGVVHTIFGVPRDITLHSESVQYDTKFIHDSEATAAVWLGARMDPREVIFADGYGFSRLISQGGISPSRMSVMLTYPDYVTGGYIYLRYLNVADGKLVNFDSRYYDISDYAELFRDRGLIYENGGSTIYL